MIGDRMMGLVVCGGGKIIWGQNHFDWVGLGLQMVAGRLCGYVARVNAGVNDQFSRPR